MEPDLSRCVQFLMLSLQAGGCSLEAELGASQRTACRQPQQGSGSKPKNSSCFSGCKSVT